MSRSNTIQIKFQTLDSSFIISILIALPSPSIMRTKRKGESRSPCLRPLEGIKVLVGELLRRMEKLAMDTRDITHLIQLWSKP